MVKRVAQIQSDAKAPEKQPLLPEGEVAPAKSAIGHYKQIQSVRKTESALNAGKIKKQRVAKRQKEEREPKADKKLVFMSKSVYQKLLDNRRISTTRLTNEIFEEFKRFIKVSSFDSDALRLVNQSNSKTCNGEFTTV